MTYKFSFVPPSKVFHSRIKNVFYSGDISFLDRLIVSVVGTRQLSKAGEELTREVTKELVDNDVVIMSGLARGVDIVALSTAVEFGGKVIAVIGTPVDTAYPKENSKLQELIYNEHLLISPFEVGSTVTKGNFPARNKVMAKFSKATVVIEALNGSGTIHQCKEVKKLGRILFISKHLLELKSITDITWTKKYLGRSNCHVFDTAKDILDVINKPDKIQSFHF